MGGNAVRKPGAEPGERVTRLIMVVDGDSSHLHYTGILLQRLEYNIHTTKNAEDALEIIEVAHPALILTEITLSGMDGVELLKKVKRSPSTYSIPVFILTSSRDQTINETCIKEGCNAFLQKPVDPDVLYAAIQKATETVPRQYIRLNTCLNVIVGSDSDSNTVIGDYVSALSENGMYISTSKPKPIGLQVPLTIFLENTKLSVEGMVLYSFERGKGPLKTPGMGIRFVRITPEDQNLIKLFIGREITKGLNLSNVARTLS